ncbi:MAG: hypothetical protein AAB664_03275, partial [Patescibacteria group bacterium]
MKKYFGKALFGLAGILGIHDGLDQEPSNKPKEAQVAKEFPEEQEKNEMNSTTDSKRFAKEIETITSKKLPPLRGEIHPAVDLKTPPAFETRINPYLGPDHAKAYLVHIFRGIKQECVDPL